MNKNASAFIALLSLFCFSRCNPGGGKNTIATDSVSIAAGEASFTKNCSGCHNFKQDGIGPQLSGVTGALSPDWLLHFIKNSQQMIASGDQQANLLFTKYKKSVMPPFDTLQDGEVNQLIAYIHAQKAISSKASKKNNGIPNPIPEQIAVSNLVVNLQQVTQFPATSDKPPLARITKLGFQPVSGNLFINDLQGRLYKMKNDKPIIYLDIAKLKTKFINKPGLAAGFGSFAFHPEFASNGLLYTTHTEAPGSGKADFGYADSIKVTMQWVLTQWKTTMPNADSFVGTSREMLRVNMVTGIHGVQEITFNPLAKKGDKDYGLLYIGVGDGGSAEAGFAFLEHSIEKIWGTIIRIDPKGKNSVNGQYGIPSANPFANSSNNKAVKEIYAWGFRNPHRITWTKSGTMLSSNIGQANIESLYEVQPGHDYGWPVREGNFVSAELTDNLGNVYPLPANDSVYKITYPVAEFDHDEGKAISGGFEYWGNSIPALKGKFLFGDIPSGRLFYLDVADLKQGRMATIKEWKITINGKPETLKSVCGSDRIDLHFGRDMQGELYILTKADGMLYKMVGATD
ncbi:MAG: c-type cytochrome [Ferruginibacter sp.]|uniref:PQQ-dependent sugar dehydrogenase n=1 Tax=Ferruginibacter sp. TaxID=1940288 RepID=UPI00265B5F81|nr:PQQ-dependent sugar dehydrogenase [Ferruginibacter sp.]MDB5275736.1 c-type cytochrome [Ferruginibacter sp.]